MFEQVLELVVCGVALKCYRSKNPFGKGVHMENRSEIKCIKDDSDKSERGRERKRIKFKLEKGREVE